MKKFAAIDIGSNAIRLLLSSVWEKKGEFYFNRDSLIRIPLRLGEDSFSRKEISPEKAKALSETMQGFYHLIKAYGATDYMACATSAMREAENGNAVMKKVNKASGLNIEIIPGHKEAEIIYSNHVEKLLEPNNTYLYIDVGGGSTELTLFKGAECFASKSFNAGTVRILQGQLTKEIWDSMQKWIQENVPNDIKILGIGSGGNINKVSKMIGKKGERTLAYKEIQELYEYLGTFNYEERIQKFKLKPDRADVILPAMEIFTSVMKWANIKKIYVPSVGLADGMIHQLAEKHMQETTIL